MSVFLIMALLLFAAGCGGNDDTGSAEQSTSTESAGPTTTATSEPSQASTDMAGTTKVSSSASATEDATEPLPTANPTDGVYRRLTFEEAQALTDFELVMPDPIPSTLEFVAASVPRPPAPPPPPGTPFPTGEAAWGESWSVKFFFRPTSGEKQVLTFTESSRDIEMGSSGEGETITIDGTEVTKFTRDDPSGTLLIYLWEAQDLHFMMNAIVGPDLPITEEDLEQLIAGTLG